MSWNQLSSFIKIGDGCQATVTFLSEPEEETISVPGKPPFQGISAQVMCEGEETKLCGPRGMWKALEKAGARKSPGPWVISRTGSDMYDTKWTVSKPGDKPAGDQNLQQSLASELASRIRAATPELQLVVKNYFADKKIPFSAAKLKDLSESTLEEVLALLDEVPF